MSTQQDDGQSSGSQELRDILSDVLRASKLPAKKRGSPVKPDVETLASLSYDQGLLPAELNELVDLVTTPNFLDQASLASIVRSLYPATTVSSDVVVKVVGCLGHGKLKPSLTVQGALLRWLVMIYHIIENQAVLSQSYAVLFNLLDTAAIRAQLCHLLALITRRRHVRPYRIQSLLSLSRQTGNDPPLTGLLRVFKDYYPEIIVGEATRGKASAFKHPDPQWRERLDEIQRDHAERVTSRSEGPLSAFRVARHRFSGRKSHLIPEVHTSHATENSVTLEEIENVDGFVKKIESIELPNQLIAVLGDPLLQKFLLLRPQAEAHQRASNWLSAYAQDLMSEGSDAHLIDVLEMLKSYVSAMKDLPPLFLTFFSEYFEIWNGREGKDTIFEILSYTPLLNFQELFAGIFKPLEAKTLDGTTKSQLDILKFYTRLLQHWTMYLLSLDSKSEHAATSVSDLANHVNDLCLTVLQTSPSISTHSEILNFFEQTATLASDSQLLAHTRIAIPPSSLVYILHFSSSLSTLSRLCGILAKYKEGFQKAMATSRASYTPEYVNEFNGFLMDICNCIWRSRAFNKTDTNSHGCLIPQGPLEAMTSYVATLNMSGSLSSLFSLSYSPILSLSAISYFRDLEDNELERGSEELGARHAGPITRASLNSLASKGGLKISWDDYRLGVLDYLEKRGMPGVGELMNNTMTNLMRRKSGKM
ncbi:Mis6-domain-containing protein [Biscogniauxia mediterranea]|nr:Mis6-domain-containing protein [Biscogniauxia mediterranea]